MLSILAACAATGPLACGVERTVVDPESTATADGPAVPSPSGRYALRVVRTEPERLDFEVLDAGGEALFRSDERFDDRSRTMFLWDADGRVWVYSGDVGTFFWERGTTPDVWRRHVYADSDVPAPPALREARPGQHPR